MDIGTGKGQEWGGGGREGIQEGGGWGVGDSNEEGETERGAMGRGRLGGGNWEGGQQVGGDNQGAKAMGRRRGGGGISQIDMMECLGGHRLQD